MDNIQQRLQHLKNKGFNSSFCLDIGACIGEFAHIFKSIWDNNSSDILLIEANKDNEKELMHSGFHYKIALLGNEEKEEVDFFKIKNGYNTGNSIFKEQTKHYTGDNFTTDKLPMTTVDKLLETHWNKKPDFIKMDVQGAELLILEGAKKSLTNCQFILLETQLLEYNKNAPMISDVFKYMEKIGFQLYDHLANHYLPNGDLMQMDILFINKNSQFIKKDLLV